MYHIIIQLSIILQKKYECTPCFDGFYNKTGIKYVSKANIYEGNTKMKQIEDIVVFNSSGDTLTVAVRGEIDHHSAKELKRYIDSHVFIERPNTLCMDLSAVSFMDSSGLGLILGRYRLSTELGIDFKVLDPTDNVMKILRLAGCERILHIVRGKEAK